MRDIFIRGLELLSKGVELGLIIPLKFLATQIRGDQYPVLRWYPPEEGADLSPKWRRYASAPVEAIYHIIGMPLLAVLERTIGILEKNHD